MSYLSLVRMRTACQALVCTLMIFSCMVYANIQSIQHSNHRVKRKVVFTSSSKFFFRLNGKLQDFNYTDIFATGYTIRINYDLPSTIPKRYKLFKRDIHNDIVNIPDEFAKHGFSCMLKRICNIISSIILTKSCGFFCGVINIITKENGMESNFFKNIINGCGDYEALCPHDDQNESLFGFG